MAIEDEDFPAWHTSHGPVPAVTNAVVNVAREEAFKVTDQRSITLVELNQEGQLRGRCVFSGKAKVSFSYILLVEMLELLWGDDFQDKVLELSEEDEHSVAQVRGREDPEGDFGAMSVVRLGLALRLVALVRAAVAAALLGGSTFRLARSDF